MVTLEACRLFRQLSSAELKALRCIAREKHFLAGDQIFKEGDNGDGIFLVKEGQVEISALVGQSRCAFSRVGPGEIFGEMAVIECKPRSATAAALVPTDIYFIARDEILVLVERSPVLALSLLREISQRLREFNRQYLREVLQAERLSVVGRFARSIVHDLKNPLNIIGLTAEMASMDHATPAMRQQVAERIRKQVDRISEMISEILDFTESTPAAACVLAPADYGAFVRQLIEELRPEVALKSTTIELAEPLPSTDLLLNPKRLRRVFCNLIHNATDAMPLGGRITVRCSRDAKEVVTEIEDTGPGLPPEMAGRLFETFATHGKAHGTGLGLSICKRVIEDHRGWISARSEPGRGAVFSFGLPLPNR